ncbi:hypothetical protein [Maridesulfovibrio frigidus]|uniref:hypothetical protein n=1 Tax=Maridesulfovibrio frigidus TaxID=340956 RepID=UPI0004E0BACE|nr:hypothetical protein [Maridesulfovibrio frigidus]
MKKMRSLIFVILVCFTVVVTIAEKSQAFTEIVSVDVGGAKVVLPEINGFDGDVLRFPKLKEFFTTFVPKTNVLLAAYLKDSELKVLIKGKGHQLDEYFFLQVAKELIDMDIYESDFDTMKGYVREDCGPQSVLFEGENIKDALDEAETEANDKYEWGIDVEHNETKLLGITGEERNYIAQVLISKMTMSVDGVQDTYVQVIGVSSMRASDRFISVYLYKVMKSDEDIKYVKNKLNKISKQIIADNPNSLIESDQ